MVEDKVVKPKDKRLDKKKSFESDSSSSSEEEDLDKIKKSPPIMK